MAFKKDTLYTAPANSSAFLAIPVTLGFCRRMEIKETYAAGGAQAAQGLQYQLFLRESGQAGSGSWGPVIQADPGETIYVGDPPAEGQGLGPVLGMVAQTNFFTDARGTTSRNADTPIRVASGTASTTPIKVSEYQ